MASQERAAPEPDFGAGELLCSGRLDSANGEMLSFFMEEKCLGVMDRSTMTQSHEQAVQEQCCSLAQSHSTS